MTTTLAGATTSKEVTTSVQKLETAAAKIQTQLAVDIQSSVKVGQKLVVVAESDTESTSTSTSTRPPSTRPSTKPTSATNLPTTVARHCGLINTYTCGPTGATLCAAADACPVAKKQPEEENLNEVEFTTENTLQLLSNPTFMATSGKTITADIAETVTGYRAQGKQLVDQVNAEITTKKLVATVATQKALADTAVEKITALREDNAEAVKRLKDVEQLTEVKTIVELFNKTDTGAAEAATKRAAVEVLVDKLYTAEADAVIKNAEAETVTKQLEIVKTKIAANDVLRKVETDKVLKVVKEIDEDHRQQRMCALKVERLTMRKERADKAAENADMIVEDKKKALVVNEAENATAELEAAVELSETLVRQVKSKNAALVRAQTASDLAIAKIDKIQIDAGLDNQLANLSTEKEVKEKAAIVANDLLAIATIEKSKGDDEVTTIEDIVSANTKVFTAVKLTEKYEAFIAEDKTNNDRYTKLEKDLELNHE